MAWFGHCYHGHMDPHSSQLPYPTSQGEPGALGGNNGCGSKAWTAWPGTHQAPGAGEVCAGRPAPGGTSSLEVAVPPPALNVDSAPRPTGEVCPSDGLCGLREPLAVPSTGHALSRQGLSPVPRKSPQGKVKPAASQTPLGSEVRLLRRRCRGLGPREAPCIFCPRWGLLPLLDSRLGPVEAVSRSRS